ncbi:MAG: fasciclin domain-containing protein [Bacteroidota bacterium]
MKRMYQFGLAVLLTTGGLAPTLHAQSVFDGDLDIIGFVDGQIERTAAPAMARTADLRDDPTVVEVAAGSNDFTTLVAAVQAAGLVDVLNGEGPFTVFAPSDAAFAALGEETIQDLLKPENRDQLTAILTYHVVPGSLFASAQTNADDLVALADTWQLETAQGSYLPIAADANGFKVGEAVIVQPDLAASNGVIHAIDRVLMPPTEAEL